jgi:hypothetical protein
VHLPHSPVRHNATASRFESGAGRSVTPFPTWKEMVMQLIRPVYGRCWEFTGAKSVGYGSARVDGRAQLVHRVVYEILVGPIPVGLDIDHLCRNRACYNPAHLEPVTRAENLRRGRAVAPVATHCDKGHLYDLPPKGGRIRCKTCKSEYDRARYEAGVRRCS